jgi:hypothetical protein
MNIIEIGKYRRKVPAMQDNSHLLIGHWSEYSDPIEMSKDKWAKKLERESVISRACELLKASTPNEVNAFFQEITNRLNAH